MRQASSRAIVSLLSTLGLLVFPGLLCAEVDFDAEIAPLLAGRCLECHNSVKRSGGLDLSAEPSAIKGGDSGRVLVKGIPDESELLRRVRTGEMPPESRGISQKLPEQEIDLLERWIATGAEWPKGTSDRPVRENDLHAGRKRLVVAPAGAEASSPCREAG